MLFYCFSFLSATLFFIYGSVLCCNETKEMIEFSFPNVIDQCLRKSLFYFTGAVLQSRSGN